MEKQEQENSRKAGKIASQVVAYAKSIIKPEMPLLEIAEKIENKIFELGGKPAFPVNLSINEIAAHYTPSYNDTEIAEGLLKVDIGIHVNGAIADTAFSIDLTKEKKYAELINASQDALKAAIEIIKQKKENTMLFEIGEKIQKTIESYGFTPIINLSGHQLGNYIIHAGLTIPNVNNNSNIKLKKGEYAIEPFATTGVGLVYDGKPSGIYRLESRKAIRDTLAKEILNYIENEYKTLPFCSRWIVKKFTSRALFSLSIMEKEGILHQYSQLVEKNHMPVSQAEHTILITENGVEVTTE